MKFTRTQPAGVALVVTLLVIVVLTVAVTAFMQSMSLERRTAQAYLNLLKADEAASAGLNRACNLLAKETANDQFIVVKYLSNNKPYYFIGMGKDTISGSVASPQPIEYTPLFSYLNSPSAAPAHPTPLAGSEPSTNMPVMPAIVDSAANKPNLPSGLTQVDTGWETINTGDPNFPKIRYSFWIEDLSGYLDASVVGNTENSGATHKRSSGLDPKELALYTLFIPTVDSDMGGSPASAIIQNRNLLISSETINQMNSSASPTPDPRIVQQNLTVGLRSDNERELIPLGLGYVDAGKPKYNLNTLIATTGVGANVDAIAKVINENLPSFVNRKGGLAAPVDYVKSLAANIIDSVDLDNLPTTKLLGTDYVYRGIDAYPYINELYDLNRWISTTGTNPYTVNITVETYLQLWNPSNLTVTGNLSVTYDLSKQNLNINGTDTPFDKKTDDLGIQTLSPNEFKVFSLPKRNYSFPWGNTPPASGQRIGFYQMDPGAYCEISWNGTLVDRTYGYIQRNSGMGSSTSMGSGGSRIWRGTAIGPSDMSIGQFADGRSNFFNSAQWRTNEYSGGTTGNSAWGGRNGLRGEPDKPFNQLKPSYWPDMGSDTQVGTKPTGVTEMPPDAVIRSPVALESNRAPTRLLNTGIMTRLTDLGSIFDPAQWKFSGTLAPMAVPPDKMDIPTTATADSGSGGGYTLAIGRHEFSKFNQPGQRAFQLLDLFTLAQRRSSKGLLNINTANKDALRALFAGLSLKQASNVAINPVIIFPPKASESADVIADAIIAARPFMTTSKVSNLTMPSLSDKWIFGNPQVFTSSPPARASLRGLETPGNITTETAGWDDQAAESFFANAVNLMSVRSRNFRIHVTGQVLNKTGTKPIATKSRTLDVFVNPNRDASGNIGRQTITHLYEASL